MNPAFVFYDLAVEKDKALGWFDFKSYGFDEQIYNVMYITPRHIDKPFRKHDGGFILQDMYFLKTGQPVLDVHSRLQTVISDTSWPGKSRSMSAS